MNDQYPALVTHDLYDTSKKLQAGDVIMTKQGVLRLYWKPTGGNYTADEKHDLAGFYDVPEMVDIEIMCNDVACTPAEDCVEPDHPDAWPRLLGII